MRAEANRRNNGSFEIELHMDWSAIDLQQKDRTQSRVDSASPGWATQAAVEPSSIFHHGASASCFHQISLTEPNHLRNGNNGAAD